MSEPREQLTHLDCLQYGRDGGCEGAVEYRLPLSGTGRAFPRCDRHWSQRLDVQDALIAKHGHPDSDTPPSWFDPEAAGERWDDEY